MPQKLLVKTGPKPQFKKKPLTIPCLVNEEEDEFITRAAYDLGMSKSRFLISGRVNDGWKTWLERLRLKQKNVAMAFRHAS